MTKNKVSKKSTLICITCGIIALIVFLIGIIIYINTYGQKMTADHVTFDYTITEKAVEMEFRFTKDLNNVIFDIIYQDENGGTYIQPLNLGTKTANTVTTHKQNLKTIQKELTTDKIDLIYLRIKNGTYQNDPPSGLFIITGIFLICATTAGLILLNYYLYKSKTIKKENSEANTNTDLKETTSNKIQTNTQIQANQETKEKTKEEIEYYKELTLKKQKSEIEKEQRAKIRKEDETLRKDFEERQRKANEIKLSPKYVAAVKSFNGKYGKPKLHCKDNDYVRSKMERAIDDFFYENRIVHVFEMPYKPPKAGGKNIYPDFYLPEYNLYIEYFGNNDDAYIRNRDNKIKMYHSDPSIRFEYLTFEDDPEIYERLKGICRKYNIPLK